MRGTRTDRFAAARKTHGIWAAVPNDVFAELTGDGTMDQPQVTDFTEILPMIAEPGKHVIRVKLDSGASILVASDLSKEEAEKRELAINQAMIEFRTKRNAWETNLAALLVARNALALLNLYVEGGMDYSDAEFRVASECNLTAPQVTDLRERYDK